MQAQAGIPLGLKSLRNDKEDGVVENAGSFDFVASRNIHCAQDDKGVSTQDDIGLGVGFGIGVVVVFLDLELDAEVANELRLAALRAEKTAAGHEDE